MTAHASPRLIAVVGGSGAGKSWFAERLCRLLGDQAGHLHLDHFYRDRSHLPLADRRRINFDEPDAIDWTWTGQVLRACRAGVATPVPRYDFATHTRSPVNGSWQPRAVVIVDGLWLLHVPALRSLFDLAIYLDTPVELRGSRRLARDVAERGYTRDAVEQQWRSAVTPMHDRYVEPQKHFADVVLAQPFRLEQLEDLADRLVAVLAHAPLAAPVVPDAFRAEFVDLLAHHEVCH